VLWRRMHTTTTPSPNTHIHTHTHTHIHTSFAPSSNSFKVVGGGNFTYGPSDTELSWSGTATAASVSTLAAMGLHIPLSLCAIPPCNRPTPVCRAESTLPFPLRPW
jgi:hypothetical protein